MRRKFSREEKLVAIQALEKGKPLLNLTPKMVSRWREEWLKFGANAFAGYGNTRMPKPLKTEPLVFRLTPAEHDRLLECVRSSGASTLSEFVRARLFAPEPDLRQVERRIAILASALERLVYLIAES